MVPLEVFFNVKLVMPVVMVTLVQLVPLEARPMTDPTLLSVLVATTVPPSMRMLPQEVPL